MTVSIWWVVFAWIWGPFVGFFAAALCHAASNGDRKIKVPVKSDPYEEPWQ